MTDTPTDAAARAYIVRMLTTPSGERKGYTASPASRRAWEQATEMERRRMLKDCGWL